MSQYFSGFPKPESGETIRSWLFKVRMHRGVEGEALIDAAINFVRVNLNLDLDYCLDSKQISSLAQTLGASVADISSISLKSTGWTIIQDSAKVFFCPTCLKADVASGRLPSWRGAWDSVETIGCTEHRERLVPLRALKTNYKKLDKAWLAFEQVVEDEVKFDQAPVVNKTDRAWKVIFGLALVVQRKIEFARKHGKPLECGMFKGIPFPGIGRALSDIWSMFLRTHRRGLEVRNLCCRILRDPVVYDVGLDHAGVTANYILSPANRAQNIRLRLICNVCVGVLIGLFSPAQLSSLLKASQYLGLSIPINSAQMKFQMLTTSEPIYFYTNWFERRMEDWPAAAATQWSYLNVDASFIE